METKYWVIEIITIVGEGYGQYVDEFHLLDNAIKQVGIKLLDDLIVDSGTTYQIYVVKEN